MRRPLGQATGAYAAVLLVTMCAARLAAQVPSRPPPMPTVLTDSKSRRELTRKRPVFSDLDLMRKNEFAHASAAAVSVLVWDGHGNAVVGMTVIDFVLNVNGTPRSLRLCPQRACGIGGAPADDRKELLRKLAAAQVAKEPLQFTGYRFLPRGESPVAAEGRGGDRQHGAKRWDRD